MNNAETYYYFSGIRTGYYSPDRIGVRVFPQFAQTRTLSRPEPKKHYAERLDR